MREKAPLVVKGLGGKRGKVKEKKKKIPLLLKSLTAEGKRRNENGAGHLWVGLLGTAKKGLWGSAERARFRDTLG